LVFGKTITIYGQYQGNNNVVASTYNFKPLDQQLGLHPVYPLIEGLKQSDIQAIMKEALKHVDVLPQRVPQRYIVGPEIIKQFADELFQSTYREQKIAVRYNEYLNNWYISNKSLGNDNIRRHEHLRHKTYQRLSFVGERTQPAGHQNLRYNL